MAKYKPIDIEMLKYVYNISDAMIEKRYNTKELYHFRAMLHTKNSDGDFFSCYGPNELKFIYPYLDYKRTHDVVGSVKSPTGAGKTSGMMGMSMAKTMSWENNASIGVKAHKPCDKCGGAKQIWMSAIKLMQDCPVCKGSGVV